MTGTTLYAGNRNYSSWSLRAALMLELAGIGHDTVVIPLDRADTAAAIMACSPSGRVPVLHHGGDVVWDSLAIGEYLAELRPRARLWPAAAAARAAARCASAEMHAGFAALRRELPMDMRARHPRRDPDDAVRADIERVVAIWSACRRSHGRGGPFLFGAPGIADAMFAPVVSRFVTYDVPLAGAAREYVDSVMAWPAMAAWMQEAEAEPWVIENP